MPLFALAVQIKRQTQHRLSAVHLILSPFLTSDLPCLSVQRKLLQLPLSVPFRISFLQCKHHFFEDRLSTLSQAPVIKKVKPLADHIHYVCDAFQHKVRYTVKETL